MFTSLAFYVRLLNVDLVILVKNSPLGARLMLSCLKGFHKTYIIAHETDTTI